MHDRLTTRRLFLQAAAALPAIAASPAQAAPNKNPQLLSHREFGLDPKLTYFNTASAGLTLADWTSTRSS